MRAAPAHDAASAEIGRHQHLLVLGLCFATIVFDGYDLIIYGSVVPELLEYEPWGLTTQRVGAIGSLALAGMLVGALAVGPLTDLVGRRKVLLGCLVWFSGAMALCALAPSAGIFAACRFLAGLGLGGVMPTTVALTVEWAPKDRHHLFNALMFSGYSVGGVLAALLAIWFLPDYGFRMLFALGALPLVTIVPLAFRYLPESRQFQPGARKSAAPGRADCGGPSRPPCSPASASPPASCFRSPASAACSSSTASTPGCRRSCRRRDTH